jgi:hypothetical protein
MNLDDLKENIIRNLSDDLLSKEWLSRKGHSYDPTFGHCYIATEAAFHLLGGKPTGWKPYHLCCKDGSHWFLKHESGIIFDPTADQFEGDTIPYQDAVGKGFLTKHPSKRAQKLIAKISKNYSRLDEQFMKIILKEIEEV